jgi:hypothetical protein
MSTVYVQAVNIDGFRESDGQLHTNEILIPEM